MSRFQWGGVVYGPLLAAWLVLEFTSLLWRGCPWPTLSRVCWDLEDAWPPMQIAFLVFLAALNVHIVARIPLWIINRL